MYKKRTALAARRSSSIRPVRLSSVFLRRRRPTKPPRNEHLRPEREQQQTPMHLYSILKPYIKNVRILRSIARSGPSEVHVSNGRAISSTGSVTTGRFFPKFRLGVSVYRGKYRIPKLHQWSGAKSGFTGEQCTVRGAPWFANATSDGGRGGATY